MKRILSFILLWAFSLGANAQFANGQVLTAQALNAALAAPTITGGTITGLSAPVPLGSGGTGATSQTAALTAILGSSTVPIANGGTNASTATAATSNLQYLQGATGSIARSLTIKLQDTVSAKDFGAVCGGSGDDTAAIQAAVNTGARVRLPAGTCIVTNAITVSIKGQIIQGEGRTVTTIKIPATFNLSALGVFIASTGEEGPVFRDFGMTFVQPDTTVRASLTSYPPAFYLRSTPRFTIQNVRVSEAMTGIDMAGGTNSGGATIDNLELSAFNVGIDIDGSLDSTRVSKLHFWNFDLTTNQLSVWNDGNTIGIRSGRNDDFHLTDSLFINNGAQVKLIQTASGTTFGDVVNTDFDTYGGLIVQAGQLSISSSFFSVGFAGNQAINQTGGVVKCSACEFEASVATTNPLLQLSGAGTLTSGYMQITGSMFRITGDMQAIGVSASSGSNALILSGNQFQLPQNTSPVNAVINVASGGRITAIANRASDKGSGTGNFIAVSVDDQHIINDNAAVGWGISLPGVLSNTIVAANSYGGTVTNKLAGSLTVSGNLSITGALARVQQEIDAGYTFSAPTTGQTVTLATGTETAIINPAGTLASLTVTLPACTSGYDGSIARYSSSQSITTLTVNATSGTVSNAPTTLAAGVGHANLCRGANTTWYPLY